NSGTYGSPPHLSPTSPSRGSPLFQQQQQQQQTLLREQRSPQLSAEDGSMFSSEVSENGPRPASASARTALTTSASASAAATVSVISSSPLTAQHQQNHSQQQQPVRTRSSIFSSLLHQLSLRETPGQQQRQPRTTWFTGRLRRRLSPLWTSFDEAAASRIDETQAQSPGLHLYDSPPPSPAPAPASTAAISSSLRRPLMATADCQLWQLQLQRRRKLPPTPSPPPSPPTPPPRRGRLRPPCESAETGGVVATENCRRMRQQPITMADSKTPRQASSNKRKKKKKRQLQKRPKNKSTKLTEKKTMRKKKRSRVRALWTTKIFTGATEVRTASKAARNPLSGSGGGGAAFYSRCQAFRLQKIGASFVGRGGGGVGGSGGRGGSGGAAPKKDCVLVCPRMKLSK
uniref:Serine/arginine repetitive matrix protein 2 n=1 Tax=Macrostomum lignano TaxID=282301 RepID=A0A1I8JGG2_9PLAT